VARFGGFIVIIGLCGIITWATDKFDGNDIAESSSGQVENVVPSQNGSSSSDGGTQEEQQSFSGTPEPLPENGTWWDYTSERQVAPLRISVSSRKHYYIKVVDAYTEARVLTLFIRSGQTAQVEVPTGTYRLKYAVGDTWYGQDDYFGPETRYLEADDIFSFEIVGQQVKGHKIELILQEGGNLSTERISEGKF
jgi:hypothetical protein